ncbi:unnamed protein product, partial [Closterium sp. NIES-54]
MPVAALPSLARRDPAFAARRWPIPARPGPSLLVAALPSPPTAALPCSRPVAALPFAAQHWPVPARRRPVAARRWPITARRGPAFAALSRPYPAAAPVAALPSPPVAALSCSRPVASLPCCRPSRSSDLTASCGPALHPPLVSTHAALPRCAA